MVLGREIAERVFEPLHHLHASVIAQGFELFEYHGRRCYAFLRNVQSFMAATTGRMQGGCFAFVGSILYLLPH